MLEVKIPSPGESITEVEIADWLVENGDYVEKDQEIAEIESDKATLPLVAEGSGPIQILAQEGETVKVGSVACKIDTSAQAPQKSQAESQTPADETSSRETAQPTGAVGSGQEEQDQPRQTTGPSAEAPKPDPDKPTSKPAATTTSAEPSTTGKSGQKGPGGPPAAGRTKEDSTRVKATPVARKMMEAHGLSLDDILQGLRRITKQDVYQAMEGLQKEDLPARGDDQPQTDQTGATRSGDAFTQEQTPSSGVSPAAEFSREEQRKKMSRLRRKLSERLVSVKNETAMLTTFNEVDMSQVMDLRKRYQKAFQDKHGIKLGLMSFFIKASAQALQAFPNVNSMIDGEEVVYPQYADIGIAVQTPKGLMVPVIRNAESRSLADLEKQVKELGEKGQKNRIAIDEMEGGTFSITNGGVFGSLLSTPIINPPQSAILGMHTIQERPVAVEGQVEIRPMMYIALSYDHRTIDGKDSVSFLMKIKELIEKPQNMLIPGGNADRQLLDI